MVGVGLAGYSAYLSYQYLLKVRGTGVKEGWAFGGGRGGEGFW